MSCRAMALSMTVLRISLTPKRAFKTPAMPPHTAPPSTPAPSVSGIRMTPGRVGHARATAAAATAPMMICPSPPMLMTPPRKAMQMPKPTRSSGVALDSVWVKPLTVPKAPLNNEP